MRTCCDVYGIRRATGRVWCVSEGCWKSTSCTEAPQACLRKKSVGRIALKFVVEFGFRTAACIVCIRAADITGQFVRWKVVVLSLLFLLVVVGMYEHHHLNVVLRAHLSSFRHRTLPWGSLSFSALWASDPKGLPAKGSSVQSPFRGSLAGNLDYWRVSPFPCDAIISIVNEAELISLQVFSSNNSRSLDVDFCRESTFRNGDDTNHFAYFIMIINPSALCQKTPMRITPS